MCYSRPVSVANQPCSLGRPADLIAANVVEAAIDYIFNLKI